LNIQTCPAFETHTWINERHWVRFYYPELRPNFISLTKAWARSDLKNVNDAYNLTSKQNQANAIDEVSRKPKRQDSCNCRDSGEVQAFQFTMTDSSKTYSGALYVNTGAK